MIPPPVTPEKNSVSMPMDTLKSPLPVIFTRGREGAVPGFLKLCPLDDIVNASASGTIRRNGWQVKVTENSISGSMSGLTCTNSVLFAARAS